MLSDPPPFPFVVLDTETTGLTPRADRVLELAIQRYEEGEKVAEWEFLFSVPGEIPPFVRVLTRIRPEDLRGKPAFDPAIVEPLLRDALLVGHNIPFDLRMLKGDGLDLEGRPWVDTAMLASLVFPELESWGLSHLSAVLGLPHEPRHRAMGDVHATAALFEKIRKRLSTLPENVLTGVKALAERGPGGYAMLFSGIVRGGAPSGESPGVRRGAPRGRPKGDIPFTGDPSACIPTGRPRGAPLPILNDFPDSPIRIWIAVKNLHSTLRSLDSEALGGFSVIHPPQFLLDPAAADAFLKQSSFTPSELTLALKLLLFRPQTQDDLPIHSDERDVWKGKLACTAESAVYREQFKNAGNVVLIDHRQLLELLGRGEGPTGNDRVIIDDASMLEDTATKAFCWSCPAGPLRAAAEDDKELTSFLDAYQIWIEKTRNFQDIRYLTGSDLASRDAGGLRERLDALIGAPLRTLVMERLCDLQRILDPRNLDGRITFIEQFRDEGQTIQSVPLDVAGALKGVLYDRFRTTLILPPGDRESFRAFLPVGADAEIREAKSEMRDAPLDSVRGKKGEMGMLPLRYAEPELTLDRLLQRVDGRIICLVPSKRLIEQLFIAHAEELEARGVALVTQGAGGGVGRMQAEFLAGGGASFGQRRAAVWFLTPWLYEGVELPAGSVDRLWIHTLPFDHPSHAVLSKRAERYGDGFNDYFLPRMLHRLFRILRTYGNHRMEKGDVLILDQRVRTRGYGKRVMEYLEKITNHQTPITQGNPNPQIPK